MDFALTNALAGAGIGVVMLRYPLNISRAIVPDEMHQANMEYYETQWPDGNSMYLLQGEIY